MRKTPEPVADGEVMHHVVELSSPKLVGDELTYIISANGNSNLPSMLRIGLDFKPITCDIPRIADQERS